MHGRGNWGSWYNDFSWQEEGHFFQIVSVRIIDDRAVCLHSCFRYPPHLRKRKPSIIVRFIGATIFMSARNIDNKLRVFTCGEVRARRSMDHNRSCNDLEIVAFGGQRSTGTWVIEATDFKFEVRIDLRVIWRPLWPQRPPKWLFQVTCT